MTRESFHETLEKMELQLLSMGELAADSVQRSVEALVTHDDGGAQAVIDADDQIDELYLHIDRGILELLALQSPVAADLRLITNYRLGLSRFFAGGRGSLVWSGERKPGRTARQATLTQRFGWLF